MFFEEYKSLDSHDILEILEQLLRLPFPSLESKSMCSHDVLDILEQ